MDLSTAGAAYLAAIVAQNAALQAYRPAAQAVVDARDALARAEQGVIDLRSTYDSALATSAGALADLEAAALGGVVIEVDSSVSAVFARSFEGRSVPI